MILRNISSIHVINFADDTVIYLAGESKDEIEESLNQEFKNISTYFDQNQLVINLNKGKTESMLFGTSKKLSTSGKEINLWYKHMRIKSTESYKYLGTLLDNTLSLKENFEKIYKRTSSKLRLLSSLHKYLNEDAKVRIYKCMILPCIKYNCTIKLQISETQCKQFQAIDKIIERGIKVKQPSVENEIKKHAVLLVRKCLEDKMCDNFKNYFEIKYHQRDTRNNGLLIKIPKTKLQYAKHGFFSSGATLDNTLPIEIHSKENFSSFRKAILKYFI